MEKWFERFADFSEGEADDAIVDDDDTGDEPSDELIEAMDEEPDYSNDLELSDIAFSEEYDPAGE